jgi:hypothetical protein
MKADDYNEGVEAGFSPSTGSGAEYEPFEKKMERQRIEAAEAREETAKRERDAAVAELEKVKSDIGWMMKHALIRDIIFQSEPIPAGEKPYQMQPDDEDTDRLRWLNENGRVSMGSGCFTLSFNHGGGDIGSQTLPTPYNIRHLLDLCRQNSDSATKT